MLQRKGYKEKGMLIIMLQMLKMNVNNYVIEKKEC